MNSTATLSNWLPLESNSTIINNYIRTLGATEMLRYFDIVSFDEEGALYIPQPVFAGLFTYPDVKTIKENSEAIIKAQEKKEHPKDLYFMEQTAKNACGTVGILHALLNIYESYQFLFEEGFVAKFHEATKDMNAEERAEYLQNSKQLHEMHKAAVHQSSSAVSNETKVNHHFITILWKDGKIYELDGRKPFPIEHGECKQEDFLQYLFTICQEQFISKAPGEVDFNLMVLSTDFN